MLPYSTAAAELLWGKCNVKLTPLIAGEPKTHVVVPQIQENLYLLGETKSVTQKASIDFAICFAELCRFFAQFTFFKRYFLCESLKIKSKVQNIPL